MRKIKGSCCRQRCKNPRARGNNLCKIHHNAQMRKWRKKHKLTGEALKRANARSYLHVYIRRGKIVKQNCAVPDCGRPGIAYHNDYDKPLDVTWYCVGHHRMKRRREMLDAKKKARLNVES